MAGRQFTPGSRNPRFRPMHKISKNRIAWSRTVFGLIALLKYDPNDPEETDLEKLDLEESGESYRLMFERPGRRPVYINLTALTAPELETIHKIFTLAYEQALPIVEMRDKVARDAERDGDDSFARNYRAVPQFVVREGEGGTHDQSILDGSEDASEGHGGDS